MSNVPKFGEYEPAPRDLQFRLNLDAWRSRKMQDMFGLAFFKNMGAAFVMGDDILTRVADCARVGIISTIEDLERETMWYHAREYGSEVLALISE